VRLAAADPVVVVHGGGRAIDAELKARGIAPRFVDGLRITDAATLEAVVSVLAGRNNTALVAAVCGGGARAVGLTGADAMTSVCEVAPPFATVSGEVVDLGLVGHPEQGDPTLVSDLLRLGYVPILASIGVSRSGQLLNVNADSLAGYLAAAIHAQRLIIAGGTAGVLDGTGATIPRLAREDMDQMIRSGAAHSGMVAKLAACRRALDSGVPDICVVSGRGADDFTGAPGTRVESGLVGAPGS
jgi:acetylglutamate kinase